MALADAAKDANSRINPGYDIEVVIEALEDGSFRAKIRALYKTLGNLFSGGNLKAIILSVIAAYVYEKTLAPDQNITVNVTDDMVVIEQGNKQIIVPRLVHEAKEEAKKSPKFKERIGRSVEAVAKDAEVIGISFDLGPDPHGELPIIPRADLERLAVSAESEEEERAVMEEAELEIIRAILAVSRRKWEFSWRGFKIAAPVLDHRFYQNFSAHRITIAPGDRLRAILRIYQKRQEGTGIFVNKKYEVVEVLDHIPRLRQTEMDSSM